MTFEIKLQEPKQSDYIFIDSQNKVHLLVPVVGGDTIGLDNTCKMASELRNFLLGSHGHPSAQKQLTNYAKLLEKDISQIPYDSYLCKQKKERLLQINKYLAVLKIISHAEFYPELTSQYITFPKAINTVMARQNNCLTMRLSPSEPDYMIAINKPIFSLSRKIFSFGNHVFIGNNLSKTLADLFDSTNFIAAISEKDKVVALVVEKLGAGKGASLDSIRNAIDESLNELYISNNIDLSGFNIKVTSDGTSVDENYLKETLCVIDLWSDTSNSDLCGYILSSTLTDYFWQQCQTSSYFDENETEALSILVQFFLGQCNLYCYANDLSKTNFGSKFDRSYLRKAVANTVIYAKQNYLSVEEQLLRLINTNYSHLGLSQALTGLQMNEVKKLFNLNFSVIKDSPHFDEFTLFSPGIKGDFINHQNRISMHFADFFNALLPTISDNIYYNSQELQALQLELMLTRSCFDQYQGRRLPSINKSINQGEWSCYNHNWYSFIDGLRTSQSQKWFTENISILAKGNKHQDNLSSIELALLKSHPQWLALTSLPISKHRNLPNNITLHLKNPLEVTLNAFQLNKFFSSKSGHNFMLDKDNVIVIANLLVTKTVNNHTFKLLKSNEIYELIRHENWPVIKLAMLDKSNISETEIDNFISKAKSIEGEKLAFYLPDRAKITISDLHDQVANAISDYYNNRSILWIIFDWFWPNQNRARQLFQLTILQQDLSVIENKPANISVNINKLVNILNVLDAIEQEIDYENNRKIINFGSKLQSKIQDLKLSLKNKYFANKTIKLSSSVAYINEQQQKIIPNERSPLQKLALLWWTSHKIENIKKLPSYFHSEQAVMYFNLNNSSDFNNEVFDSLKTLNNNFNFAKPFTISKLKLLAKLNSVLLLKLSKSGILPLLVNLNEAYLNDKALLLVSQLDDIFFSSQGIQYLNYLDSIKLNLELNLVLGLNKLSFKDEKFKQHLTTCNSSCTKSNALTTKALKHGEQFIYEQGLFTEPNIELPTLIKKSNLINNLEKTSNIVEALIREDVELNDKKGVFDSILYNSVPHFFSLASTRQKELKANIVRLKELSSDMSKGIKKITIYLRSLSKSKINIKTEQLKFEKLCQKLSEKINSIKVNSLTELCFSDKKIIVDLKESLIVDLKKSLIVINLEFDSSPLSDEDSDSSDEDRYFDCEDSLLQKSNFSL